jgi:hypothetical protein
MRFLWGRWITISVQLLIICGCFANITNADDGSSQLVGSFADPNHLIFTGESPFTDKQIHDAVQGDLQLQIASSPSAKLSDYLSILDTRLRDGFHRAGYHHPLIKVNAEPATGNVVVDLDLGKRWKCGKVVILDAKTVPVDELIKRLTEPTTRPFFDTTVSDDEISVSEQPGSDDSNDPQWVPGKPAPFDNYRPDELTSFVRQQLATLGYFHPFLRVSVEPGDKDANLIVDLIDEGPRAILDHVEFETLSRNSPADVLHLLNIKPGDPVNLNRICELERLLWDSGRFIHSKILVQRIHGDDVRVVLRIKINEAENVPLLTEPLTDVDQALLRFGKWCLLAGDDGDNIVVKGATPDFDVQWVWGGLRGSAVSLRLNKGILADQLGDDREIDLFTANKMAGVYLPLAGIKLEGPCDPSSMHISLKCGPSPDPDDKDPWIIGVNANITAASDTAQTKGMQVDRWIAPAALLTKSREKGRSCSIDGPILTYKSELLTLRIDGASGRLLDGSIDDTTRSEHIQIFVQHGALDAMQQSLHKSAGTNIFSSDQPFSSCCMFLNEMVFHSATIAPKATPKQRQKLAEIAGRVVGTREFGQLGDLFLGLLPANDSDSFFLPIDNDFTRPQGMAAMCAMAGLTANNRLFAARSWPWTVGRSACFAMCNLTGPIEPELQRLYSSPDTGPLANLVVAEWVRSISPEQSRIFARNGLVKLSPELFAKDCQALFNGNLRMTAMALQIAENLRSLSDDDIEVIATQIPSNSAAAFRATVKELKFHPGPITPDTIAAALRKAWDSCLHRTMEKELNSLAAQR